MKQKRKKMMKVAYTEYLKIPKATFCNHENTIYKIGWCVEIGRDCELPHPHRHFTFEEFVMRIITDNDFRSVFIPEL